MDNSWKEGTPPIKKEATGDINIYRPIVLLENIYKIRETIISNRLSPIMGLLTNEFQCAYKTHRSTKDIIYSIKRK